MPNKSASLQLVVNTDAANIKTNVKFFTQDYGTAKLMFTVFQNNKVMDLTGATSAKLTFIMADNSTFEVDATIDDYINGLVSYILTSDILQHFGTAEAELDIYFGTSQGISAGQFQFTIIQSLTDQDNQPVANYYIASVNTIKDEYQSWVDAAKADNQQKFDDFLTWYNNTTAENQSKFDDWFNNVKGQLSTDVAGNLQNEIDAHTSQLADISTYKEINMAIPFGTNLTPLKGDGSDETSILLAALNYVGDNHLSLYIPKNMTIFIDSLTLTGKSNFGINCEGIIKRLDNSPTVGALIKFDSCSDISIPRLNFDGNGLNNGCVENVAYTSNQEQKHNLFLTNCQNVHIGILTHHNTCGDGLYLTNSCENITVYKSLANADKQIGRNIVSIINGQDFHFGYIYGSNFGHYDMSGGFDIEPNVNTDIVQNVFIDEINITGGGSAPLSLLAANNSTSKNIFIQSANIIRNIAYTNITENESVFISASNVHIDKLYVKNLTSYNCNIIRIDNHGNVPSGIFVNELFGEAGYKGIILGQLGANVDNIRIKAVLKNLSNHGVYMLICSNVKLDIDINSVGASCGMITKSGNFICDNVTITGDVSNRGTGTAALLSSASAGYVTNWILDTLNFTGWVNDKRIYGSGWNGATIQKFNCKNLTLLSAKPSYDQWKKGDIVYNTNPTELGTAGSKYIIDKWICITDGPGSSSTFLESHVLTGN